MNISEFFLGDFKSPSEIINVVSQYCRSNSLQDDMTNAKPLIIFQTSTQQTWLVRGNSGIYCVLDDLDKASTSVKWFIPLHELITNEGKIVGLTVRDKSDKTGLLDIGNRRGWLFSKKLFADENITAKIQNLVAHSMAVKS